MIEKLKEHDVIDPKTDKIIGTIGCDLREIMDKLNEVIDAVNALVYEHDKDSDWYDGQTRPENVQKEPITLLDIFNEMGEMYSSLWNKMEDIHHDLKTKGDNNE